MIRIKEESQKDKHIEEDVPVGPVCGVRSVRCFPFVPRLLLYLSEKKQSEKKKSEMKKK